MTVEIGRMCVCVSHCEINVNQKGEKNASNTISANGLCCVCLLSLNCINIWFIKKFHCRQSAHEEWTTVPFVIFDFLWHFHLISNGWNGSNYQNLLTTQGSVLSTAAVIIVRCATAKVCSCLDFYTRSISVIWRSLLSVFFSFDWETP